MPGPSERLRVDIAGAQGAQLEIRPHRLTDQSGFVRASYATLGNPYVYLRLYPAVLAKLRATVGTVVQKGVHQEQIVGEAVTFNGSAQASTEFLVHSGLSIDWAGLTFDINGDPVEISIVADAPGGLQASQPFYGAAICSYITQYRLLKYSYQVEEIVVPNLGSGGARITGGSVLAFYDGEVASYELPAPELPTADQDRAELYRIVSYSILQKGTEYEKPPAWPNGTFLHGKPDPDTDWIQVERVHEIGWIDGFCRLSTRRFPVYAAEPYVGASNYKIPTETKMTSDSELQSQGFSTSCIAQAHQQQQDRS